MCWHTRAYFCQTFLFCTVVFSQPVNYNKVREANSYPKMSHHTCRGMNETLETTISAFSLIIFSQKDLHSIVFYWTLVRASPAGHMAFATHLIDLSQLKAWINWPFQQHMTCAGQVNCVSPSKWEVGEWHNLLKRLLFQAIITACFNIRNICHKKFVILAEKYKQVAVHTITSVET